MRLAEMAQSEIPRLMKRLEVARHFGCTPRTLWNWEQKGLLTPVRVGRSVFYNLDQIETLMRASTPPSSGVAQSPDKI